MRSKDAAFTHARTVLSQLGIPKKLPTLHNAGVSIKHSIIGGSHSAATYVPLTALKPLGLKEKLPQVYFGDTTSLYVHIPFCETQCTFCHYTVRPYRGKAHSSQDRVSGVERYLEALTCEIETRGRDLGGDTAVSSIYIGGGTPLVLEQKQLLALLRTLRANFNVLPDAEICVEGSPLTIVAGDGLEKMQALKEAGVTRFSFGVQSFDDEVLKYSARGYKKDTALVACERVSLVFQNWNLDLIQSLYKGRPDEIWENLQVLDGVRPPHLTWYHGRFADRPQGDWYNNRMKKPNFENEEETLLGRMMIWEALTEMGYGQTDGNRFTRLPQYSDTFKKVRISVSSNLLGLGASAYSHLDMRRFPRDVFGTEGLFFRNNTNVGSYVDAVETRESNIVESSLVLGSVEYLAASYVVGLRGVRFETADDINAREMCPELSSHYSELEARFLELNLIEECEEGGRSGLRLSLLGRLFEDEVLSLFYLPG